MTGSDDSKRAISELDFSSGGGRAVGYSPADKQFLEGIFLAFPEMRDAFLACSRVNAKNRFHYVRKNMETFERQVWADVGIPEGKRETLKNHVVAMAAFAFEHPQEKYDLREVAAIITIWGMPKAIVNETPLDLMPRERRNILENLAAKMIMLDENHRGDFALWEKLREAPMLSNPYNNDPDAASFVHDIDHAVTAMKAREYQAHYPDKAVLLETLVENCRHALLTPEMKALWDGKIGKPPEIIREVTVEGRIDIIPHGAPVSPILPSDHLAGATVYHGPAL